MLEKIVLGLVASALGALLVYAFRVRQLYVVIPRLFSTSAITTHGKLVELRVYNKGRGTEEDVVVNLDPSLKYEVVASTDATSTLGQSAIKISRIVPGGDYSVLLLVEGGEFTRERISTISSKSTKGRLLQGIEHVPPNAGSFLLAAFSFIALIAIPIASMDYYFDWKRAAEEEVRINQLARLDYLMKDGWSNLEAYSSSKFRGNYADGEFPIHLTNIARKGDVVELRFRIVNKSAANLRLFALSEWPYKSEDPEIWNERHIFSHAVQPQDANNLSIKLYFPKGKKGDATIKFSLSVGEEYLITLIKRVTVDV